MKHIVRAFVVVLVLTGAVASTQISSASAQNKVDCGQASACFRFLSARLTIRTPAAWLRAANSGLAKSLRLNLY